MDEMLTAEDLAEKLRVTPWTIRYWARLNRIPSMRPGKRCLRFSLVDVLAELKKDVPATAK